MRGALSGPAVAVRLESWRGGFGQVAALDKGPGSVMGYAVPASTMV